jgi:2-oxoglutarate ferredoxin oxidoreductase subunit delta
MSPSVCRGEVIITREWCKGCRICVELCPEEVLGLDAQDKAVVLHLEACTACLLCELHCPDLAVEVHVSAGRGVPAAEAQS